MTAMQILWLGAIAFGGWIWFYLFGRQFMFNFGVAFPLIRKMNAEKELINVNSRRYTVISSVVTGLLLLAGLLMLLVKALYLKIGFFAGAIVCILMLWGKINPQNKGMFDSFCASYYRFIEDDELRQAVFEKKYKKIIKRVHDMGCDTAFIPSFKDKDD